ncbi:MAG: fam-b protein [Candidatus Goldbacteria bacterium]|nr:fam-b protein [Candidatus Goldiibacteriota bacterium]
MKKTKKIINELEKELETIRKEHWNNYKLILKDAGLNKKDFIERAFEFESYDDYVNCGWSLGYGYCLFKIINLLKKI